jgi:thiamine-phosphate pyrophosphorylase
MLRYAITDRTRFPGDPAEQESALLHQASSLAAEGIDFLQLREKDLEAAALAQLARQILTILRHPHNSQRSTTPKLLINSRADIAIAAAADGVHLTSSPDELTPAQIRQLYSTANLPTPIVSISCHTLEDVAHAAAKSPGSEPASAATLILFGPIFEKVVAKPHLDSSLQFARNSPAAAAQLSETWVAQGIGLDLLHQACTLAAPIPVLALGGITHANTLACLAAGAAGIAAIRLFNIPVDSESRT